MQTKAEPRLTPPSAGSTAAPLRAAFVLIASSMLLAPGLGAASGECRRVPLAQAPSFTNSAAWSVDGQQLFLAALLEAKVLVYDASGNVTETVSNPGRGPHEFTQPYSVQSTPGQGLLVHDRDSHSVWFDADRKVVRSLQLQAEDISELEYLSTIGRIVAGDNLVARGYVKMDGRATSGFVRFSLADQAVRFDGLAIDFEAEQGPGRFYQRVLGSTLAEAGGDVYGLVFGSPSKIYRLTPKTQLLTAFPQGYEPLKPLPETPPNALGTALQQRFLEHQTMPVGLYGAGEYLYLLTREPRPAGGTTWRLHQVDPQRDELRHSRVLPTHTEHLLLAPGSLFWALIEKGPVSNLAQYDIQTMVLVPAAWLEDSSQTQLSPEAKSTDAADLCQ